MKKGFTLIELLAVIVILAIIAVIAVPIVLNIIDETKDNAGLRSAEMYIKAAELSIAQSTLKDINIPDGEYSLKDGDICIGTLSNNECNGKLLEVEVNGKVPESGTIKITNGNISDLSIMLNEKTIIKNDEGKLVFEDVVEQKEAAGLYDSNNNLIASWEELVEKYDFENLVQNGGWDEETEMGLAAVVIYNNYSDATKLVIADTVTHIGYEAFYYCEQLTTIILPNSVTSIGHYSFYGCTSLISITIPNSVTSIGDGAFYFCNKLTTITILNSATTIGEGVFEYSENLTTIYYKGSTEGAPWGAENATVESNF